MMSKSTRVFAQLRHNIWLLIDLIAVCIIQLLWKLFKPVQNQLNYVVYFISLSAAIGIGKANPLSGRPLNRTELIGARHFLERSKRDEDPGSVFGKGVAFFLGEPCETTCNRILFHVWCNLTTHRCECLPEYPVNVDNKYCLKAVRIDDQCEFSESCQYSNSKSECSETGICKCAQGYFAKYDESKDVECVLYDSPFHIRIGNTNFDFMNNMEFITIFSLILSFILIIILFCLVIKLINKNNQIAKSEQPICDRIPPPPPVILSEPEFYTSLESSPRSLCNFNLSEKPKFSFIPPLPPNLLGSRRQSLSSLHSQSSIKSYSSTKSQNSCRNYRSIHCQKRHEFYRKASSPLESVNQAYLPNHLPNNGHMRTKCSNSRCGTGSKIKSEVCLVHNNHNLQEELFVPNN